MPATQALALDDSLAEAHTSLAFAMDLYAWNWFGAEAQYRQAIALSPARLIEGGIPTEAMIAHVLVARYGDCRCIARRRSWRDKV